MAGRELQTALERKRLKKGLYKRGLAQAHDEAKRLQDAVLDKDKRLLALAKRLAQVTRPCACSTGWRLAGGWRAAGGCYAEGTQMLRDALQQDDIQQGHIHQCLPAGPQHGPMCR